MACLNERRSRRRITIGADEASDVFDFVQALEPRDVTPDIAINGTVGTASTQNGIDRRRPSRPFHKPVIRKGIEEILGWIESTGGLPKTR